ncbi:MAG: hypothetical protein ABEJ72_03635, partial [Candidatus Aenigmatarchaeota archaeon]
MVAMERRYTWMLVLATLALGSLIVQSPVVAAGDYVCGDVLSSCSSSKCGDTCVSSGGSICYYTLDNCEGAICSGPTSINPSSGQVREVSLPNSRGPVIYSAVGERRVKPVASTCYLCTYKYKDDTKPSCTD